MSLNPLGVWRKPALRDSGGRREVGWLDLFFDLIFVVIISVVAQEFAHDVTAAGLLHFVLKFLGVFWAWNAFAYYTERFESDGLDARLFTFLAILSVAGLAIWGRDGLGHNYIGFALSYIAARALNIGMWLRAAHHNPRFRTTAGAFTAGFTIASALIIVSFMVDDTTRLVLWTIAILVDLATPALSVRTQRRLPALSRDKYPERFGLLTLIVLGEVVSSAIGGAVKLEGLGRLNAGNLLSLVLALAIGFAMWWIYYDFVSQRPPRGALQTVLVWLYLHFFLLIGMVTVGVAAEAALISGGGASDSSIQRLLLISGGVVLLAIAALEDTLDRAADEERSLGSRLTKPIAGVLVGLVGLVPGLPIAVALATLVLAFAVSAAYESIGKQLARHRH